MVTPARDYGEILKEIQHLPIGKLLAIYPNKGLTESFINDVVSTITPDELTKVADWAGLNEKNIELIVEDVIKIALNRPVVGEYDHALGKDRGAFVVKALRSINYAVTLKKELQNRYKATEVDYNRNCNPTNTEFTPTRNWMTINGENAKKYDDGHGGAQKTIHLEL